MAIILALISSALFGAGDFLGGVASRRTHVLVVVGASHVVGLFLILSVAPFMADAITLRDLGLGGIAGIAGVVGITCLYHSLSRGPMALVAPITAVSNAAVPALWGIYFGDRLSAPQTVGVVLGLAAILLVSRVSGEEPTAGNATPGLIGMALLSGVGFGGFFICMDLTTEATTPWPLVSARVVSAGIALILLTRMRRSPIPRRDEARGAIVGAGVLDMTANLAILIAVHHGMLSLVVVLGSLYPASTVLLARYVLQERMARTQVVGLVVALAAIAAIASG
ncbi:MAG: EamA family transporter [Actinomycetota bacterium]|nr:EamA family transporter [Actinomycetota bacterium]MEE3352751.1 EamA family transporter [Actinomycetota bacterium]